MKRSLLCLAAALACAGVAKADQAADAAWKQQMENKVDALTQELEKTKLAPSEGPAAAQANGHDRLCRRFQWRLTALARRPEKYMASTKVFPSEAMEN